MTLPIVSPTLFNGHGLAAAISEHHAQPGNHVRVNVHPLLGLPVAPFIIWRGVTDSIKSFELRSVVSFRDSFGAEVTAPFTLSPDNPVTATIALAPGQMCIWARVEADPTSASAPFNPIDGRPELRPFDPRPNPVVNPGIVPPRPPSPITPRPPSGVGRSLNDLARAAGSTSGMTAEAFVSSVSGPASVGRRPVQPYTFNAPGIVEILLTGSARVSGVVWIEAHDMPHVNFRPWGILNLPHEGGARYASIENAFNVAVERTAEQAPKRRPLQETLGAVAPGAAPLENAGFEKDRVESLARPLMDDLDQLINDLSQSPFDQLFESPVTDETGTVVGDLTMSRLHRVYQGQHDPGSASFFGFKAYDDEFVESDNRIVVYWIDGFFRDFPAAIPLPGLLSSPEQQLFDSLLAGLAPGNRIGNHEDLVTAIEKPISHLGHELARDRLPELETHDDYIGLGTLVIVDRSAPLLPPKKPVIDGHQHIGWLPDPAPAARREVQLDVSGVATGGLLASEKRTPAASGTHTHLNLANDDGFHLPLALGMNVDDETLAPADAPGTGMLADRNGADSKIRYYLAQQDRFGRWSGWRTIVNKPGPRPKPPRPTLQAYYTQPTDPAASGGTVRVKVPVPETDTLAPGGFLLQTLELDATDLTTGVTAAHPQTITDPAAPPTELDFSFPGPLLAPTEQRKIRMIARWIDTASEPSADSEPATVTMTDPRPPAQLTVPDTLLYSGRPDITGLSMVEHDWTPVAGQAGFGIYYSDENRLRAHLEAAAGGSPEATLLTAIDAAGDAAARATLFRGSPELFPAHLFERLAGAVMDVSGGRKRFRHAVSGSLRILNFYRISAESASNARVDLSTLPLLIFGVPNADPPAAPVIEVRPAAMASNTDTYAVDLTVSLVVGVTPADTYRLRRSSLSATDVLRMPVLETGPMGPLGDDGKQIAETSDNGPVQISATAKLAPWVRYYWVAEAQGAPAPGSVAAGNPVPGTWSRPSESVSLVLIPPQAPAAVQSLTATGTPVVSGRLVDVTLDFDHEDALLGGAVGRYRARLLRRAPGATMVNLAEVEMNGTGPFSLSGMDPGNPADEVASGTLYRIVLIDPLGRESAPADVVIT